MGFCLFFGIGYGKAQQTDGAVLVVCFFQQLLGQGKNGVQGGEFFALGDAAGYLGEIMVFHFECEGVATELSFLQTVYQFYGYVVEFDDER